MGDESERELTGLAKGLRRTFATARLTGKLATATAKRFMFASKQPAAAAFTPKEVAAAVERAKQLVAQMGGMKGLVMKAGQIASYMPGALPPEAQQVLAGLQTASTPMAFAQIAELVERELGAPIGERFARFDTVPFAAASIGQVHRADLADGTAVAVKVQYPDIERAIASDLKTVGTIARLSTIGSPIDGRALAGELTARLLEECDYEREAANQTLFARLLADIPGAHVPRVIADRSTRRVLTTELSAHVPLSSLAGDQAVRDRVGQLIFRSCFELIFRRGIYNADPHPGNYLADPKAGDVTFLDFGCVRRFDAEMIARWKRMARAVIANKRPAFIDEFIALGFVADKHVAKFDWAYQFGAMRELYRPFLERDFRYTNAFVRASFGHLMFDNPNKWRIAMPPEWLFLNRLQWGLYAVLAQLDAAGPWGAIIDEQLAATLEPV